MTLFSVFSKNQTGFAQTTNPTGTVGSSLGKMGIRAFAASISGPAGYCTASPSICSLTSQQFHRQTLALKWEGYVRRHAGIVSWPATQYQPEHAFLLVPGVGGSLPGTEAREFRERISFHVKRRYKRNSVFPTLTTFQGGASKAGTRERKPPQTGRGREQQGAGNFAALIFVRQISPLSFKLLLTRLVICN